MLSKEFKGPVKSLSLGTVWYQHGVGMQSMDSSNLMLVQEGLTALIEAMTESRDSGSSASVLLSLGFDTWCNSRVDVVRGGANLFRHHFHVAWIWLVQQALVADPNDPVQDTHVLHVLIIVAQSALQLNLKICLKFLLKEIQR